MISLGFQFLKASIPCKLQCMYVSAESLTMKAISDSVLGYSQLYNDCAGSWSGTPRRDREDNLPQRWNSRRDCRGFKSSSWCNAERNWPPDRGAESMSAGQCRVGSWEVDSPWKTDICRVELQKSDSCCWHSCNEGCRRRSQTVTGMDNQNLARVNLGLFVDQSRLDTQSPGVLLSWSWIPVSVMMRQLFVPHIFALHPWHGLEALRDLILVSELLTQSLMTEFWIVSLAAQDGILSIYKCNRYTFL